MRRSGAWVVGALATCVACSGGESGGKGGSEMPADAATAGGASGSGLDPAASGGAGSAGTTGSGATGASGGAGASGAGGGAGTTGAGGSIGSDASAASGGAGGGDGGAGSGAGGGSAEDGGTSRKLDVVLLVDNSISMADKQAVLRRTVPDLVKELTDPLFGVQDLHVGVITSSLGGHGSTTCNGSDPGLNGEEDDDHARLVGTRPRAASLGLTSGFVSWTRPEATASLVTGVSNLVTAAGEFGCGFEASLEAVYRFLADPKPPESITTGPCSTGSANLCAFPTGIDAELLGQRAAFLRPDSAVAIVLLSDENDCSTRDGAQYYFAARTDFTMPRASAACATNPNDPCCYSCATAAPAQCPADPTCPGTLDRADDKINLRCVEQKRRFGLDFLYPVARYVNALTKTSLCTSRADLDATGLCPDLDADTQPDVVPNPLFAGAAGTGTARDPSMVYTLGIVGVPWQTIAAKTDASGNPLPGDVLRYPTGSEIATRGLWPVILGDSAAGPPVPPTDPLMLESVDPRSGITPGTGEALAPPTAAYLANSVNGHEWGNTNRDDLQYACIFPLDQPRDCVAMQLLDPRPGCDCINLTAADQNPLCQAADGTYGELQLFGKGYPGLRHLALVKGLGDQGAIASICARNLTDDTRPDYGYRPAVDVLMQELRQTVH